MGAGSPAWEALEAAAGDWGTVYLGRRAGSRRAVGQSGKWRLGTRHLFSAAEKFSACSPHNSMICCAASPRTRAHPITYPQIVAAWRRQDDLTTADDL